MTFNDRYYDASVRHQIDLLRFGNGVSRTVNGILDATLGDLRKQVERRLGKATGLAGGGLRRMQELERAIVQIRSPAWNDVTDTWERTAVDVALEEPLFMAGTLTSVLPVELDLVQPSDRTLKALATSRPFQGRTLKEWARSAARSDLTRIQQQIRIGMVQGESSSDIAARVFGARGATDLTRGQAEAVTRTVINGVSNAAQQEFLAENSDLFDVEQIVATLDGRTSPVCRAEDGKQYPVGKGPIPPLHVNCRSLRVAAIDGEVVGERPFRAGTEKQMLREYASANGLGEVSSRKDLPRGHGKKFDAFARKRMRELTGQVPARTTYEEWLRRQTPEFQNDVLGPARAKLFRDGGLPLDRFVSRKGDELTLDEIRERNEEGWRRAELPQPKPANDTSSPQRRSLADAVRDSGTELRVSPSVTQGQQDAVMRGLDKVAAPSTTPLKKLILTDRIGYGDEGLPARVGGNYTSDDQGIRISARDDANGLFLRRTVLDPRDSALLPGNTQNVAQSLEQVMEMSTVHEYGHHVHLSRRRGGAVDSAILEEFRRPSRQDVSAYGRENHLEFWAESLTAYHYYPRDWLEARAPRTLAFVERILRMVEDGSD